MAETDANGLTQRWFVYGNYTDEPLMMVAKCLDNTESFFTNPYLFTGRRVDTLDNGSLKIQYNRNRYYDYYTARWLTQDPLGITPNSRASIFGGIAQFSNGMNLYEYVHSSPARGQNPSS